MKCDHSLHAREPQHESHAEAAGAMLPLLLLKGPIPLGSIPNFPEEYQVDHVRLFLVRLGQLPNAPV